MLRWKNTIGRIMVDLMWSDVVTWEGDTGVFNLTQLARRTGVRPVRLVEYLHEMKLLGYLTHLKIDYKTVQLRFRRPGWAKPTTITTPGWGR